MINTKFVALLLLTSLTAGIYYYQRIPTEESEEEGRVKPVNIEFLQNLDIDRFMGIWYVIASKPNIIEKYCHCARSNDTLLDSTTIELAETCWLLGKKITSRSKALIQEPSSGHWINVVSSIKADYWIINVDRKDYSWAVVGQPSGKGYWIFSRQTTLDQDLVDSLLLEALSYGYNLDDLEYADQTCQ